MSILKGWLGEKKTTFWMWLSLDKSLYQRFHNVIVPGASGTTQIDHILVSRFGLFIVETKNKGGWIFGDEKQAKWTQTFYGKKFSFQNPLRQTYRQKKVLAEFLGIDESSIYTVVYFVGNCKFKTRLPDNVIKSGLSRYVKRFSEKILSQEEVDRISTNLEKHIRESTTTTRDHVRSLKQRHNSDSSCPRCGSSLVLKVAKRGSRAGSNFLGCQNYPKCRFTRNA